MVQYAAPAAAMTLFLSVSLTARPPSVNQCVYVLNIDNPGSLNSGGIYQATSRACRRTAFAEVDALDFRTGERRQVTIALKPGGMTPLPYGEFASPYSNYSVRGIRNVRLFWR